MLNAEVSYSIAAALEWSAPLFGATFISFRKHKLMSTNVEHGKLPVTFLTDEQKNMYACIPNNAHWRVRIEDDTASFDVQIKDFPQGDTHSGRASITVGDGKPQLLYHERTNNHPQTIGGLPDDIRAGYLGNVPARKIVQLIKDTLHVTEITGAPNSFIDTHARTL